MKKLNLFFTFLCTVLTSFSQDTNLEFGQITIDELEEESCSLDVTAHAAYLYKEEKLRYRYIGYRWYHETTFFERIKIYDEKGFTEAKKEISYYLSDGGSTEKVSKIEACTYFLENGKIIKVKLDKDNIFEEDKNDNWKVKKFTMPSLKKGAIVEWKYKVVSPFVLFIDKLILQHDIPIKKYVSALSIPEYFVFKLYKTGVVPVEVKKYSREMNGLEGNEHVYIIEKNNIPAFKEEAFMSNRDNFSLSYDFDLSYVQFPDSPRKRYATTTWEDVAKRVSKTSFFGKSFKKRKYYEDDFLSFELEEKSNKEKIAVILDFVKSKIKWNGNYGIRTDIGLKKAYETGEGSVVDINLVLVSLLKRAGLKANPILISTRSNGIALFPSIKAYNYIIVGVEGIEEEPILLDATEKYSYLNVLPHRDLNWVGRLIREDKTTKEINLSPNRFALEKQFLKVKIQEDLSLKGDLKTTFSSHNALKYRENTNLLDDESHKEHIETEHDINVEELKLYSKNDLNKSYVRQLKFNCAGGVEKIGDKIYFSPLFFLRTKTSPFKLENRDYPVDFGYPWKDFYQVYIELPKEYEVDFIPQEGSYHLSNQTGSYTYKINQQANLLIVSFSAQFNIGVISPKYYKELKTMYRQMISKQSEKVVLKKINL